MDIALLHSFRLSGIVAGTLAWQYHSNHLIR